MPISLLELNTFGHAVCALLIYILWWNKPFEVDYPTVARGQRLWDLTALRSMLECSSSVSESARCESREWLRRNKDINTSSAVSMIQ